MYAISEDTMFDIARSRNEGAGWAWLGRQYGIPAASLKRAYQRRSAEVYRPCSVCGVAKRDHQSSEYHRFNHVHTP